MEVNNTLLDPHCGLVEHECETIRLLKKVIFGTTLVSDFIALCILVVLRKYKSFSHRIFLNILLSNLIEGIGHLIDDGLNGRVCILAAFIVQTFGFALFMWICGLTLYLFLLVMKNWNTRRYERRYFTTCWGTALVLGLTPFFTDSYGPAGAYCWVVNVQIGHSLRFIVWWAPVMFGILLIFIAFIIMHCKAARAKFPEQCESLRTENKKLVSSNLRPLTWYAASFMTIHTIMFIDRLITIKGDPIYEMRILQIISISSYGLILCTLFYLTNGKKEFTLAKFQDGWNKHRNKFAKRRQDRGVNNRAVVNNPISIVMSDIHEERRASNDGVILAIPFPGRKPKKSETFQSDCSKLDTSTSYTLTFTMPPPCKNISLGFSYSESSLTLGGVLNKPLDSDGPSEIMEKEAKKYGHNEASLRMQTLPIALSSTGNHKQPSTIRYSLPRNSEALKIYLKEQGIIRWEVWKDEETTEVWKNRLQKSVPSISLCVTICDQDNAYFGDFLTWYQIKSTSTSLTITVNDGVTKVDLIQDMRNEKSEMRNRRSRTGSSSELDPESLNEDESF